MFSNEEEYCTIGRPKGQLTKEAESKSACISKIGGYAVWNDNSTALNVTDLVCGVCESSDKMVLVAQIYAPLEFHRTLYVFCCNARRCSYSSASWKVVRNQSTEPTEASPSSIDVTKTVSTQKQVEKSKVALNNTKLPSHHKASEWESTVFSGFKEVASTSTSQTSSKNKKIEVDSDAEDEDDDMSDLLAMIATRDAQVNKGKSQPVAEPAVTSNSSGSDVTIIEGDCLETREVLSSWRIAEIDEEWSRYEDDNDDDNDNDDDTSVSAAGDESETQESGVKHSQRKGKSSKADAHIEQLIQSYLQTEDDAEVLSVMQQGGYKTPAPSGAAAVLAAATSQSSGGEGVQKKTKKSTKQGQSAAKPSSATANEAVDEEGDQKGGENDEAPSESKLAHTNSRDKVEQYFQRRVAKYPNQVLRYAYGGQPLWCTSPPLLILNCDQ